MAAAALPLGVRGAAERLWKALHNRSTAPLKPNFGNES